MSRSLPLGYTGARAERLNKLLPKLGEPKSGLDKVLDKTDDLIDKTDDLINKTKEKAKRLLDD